MRLRILTLTSAILAIPAADAFVGGRTSSSSVVPLNMKGRGGMDAYDEQMRAVSSSSSSSSSSQMRATTSSSATSSSSVTDANVKSSPRWRKKTKQLATLGPASSTFEMIEKLFLAGADVFRLNFSHGEHAQKKELLDIIRRVEAKYDHPIAILGDLQGPKLRVGTFGNPDGEYLVRGQAFRFDLSDVPGTSERVRLPHPEIIEASEVGHVLLVDDGKVKLEVVGTGPGYLDCVVVVPGKIKDKKVRFLPLLVALCRCLISAHVVVAVLSLSVVPLHEPIPPPFTANATSPLFHPPNPTPIVHRE
jgi:hypothetical protein